MGNSNPKNLKPAVLSRLDIRLCEWGGGLRDFGSILRCTNSNLPVYT